MSEFFGLIGVLVAVGSAAVGYWQSRRFVARKLRYVEAAQTAKAPFIAGIAATAIALPIVALLPIVGVGTAVLFGAGVGTGVAAGAKEIHRSTALLE